MKKSLGSIVLAVALLAMGVPTGAASSPSADASDCSDAFWKLAEVYNDLPWGNDPFYLVDALTDYLLGTNTPREDDAHRTTYEACEETFQATPGVNVTVPDPNPPPVTVPSAPDDPTPSTPDTPDIPWNKLPDLTEICEVLHQWGYRCF